MKIRLLITFLLLITFCANSIHAQKNKFTAHDSVALVCANWETDTIADGLILRKTFITDKNLFGTNQHICIIELKPQSMAKLAFAYKPHLTKTSIIAQQYNALAAVNATYFDMKHGNPICYLRINGKQVGENTPQASDTLNRKYYQYSTIALKNGRPVFLIPDSNRHWEESFDSTYTNVMTAGPMLIYNDKIIKQRKDRSFCTLRHNRTAIALKRNGTVLLVTVDGRTKQSQGMSLEEFAQTLKWLGCQTAMNLDGGGSTTCYVHDYQDNGIVNYPTDNGRFDHQGERFVSNIIMILEK